MATLGAVVSDPVPAHPHAGELGPVIDGLLTKDPGMRMPVGQAEVELARISGGAIYLPPAAPDAGRNTVEEGVAGAAEAAPNASPPVSASGPGPAAAPRRPSASRVTAPAGFRSSASLPPPPWSAEAAATLGRLPAVAPAPPRRWTGWVAAAVVLLAAAAGFIAVLTIGRLA
jgi:hypothetical protein